MPKLYAINEATGQNEPVATLSDEDSQKIGRGFNQGHSFGTITDQDSGKQYEAFQASCGADNCNCAVIVKEVK